MDGTLARAIVPSITTGGAEIFKNWIVKINELLYHCTRMTNACDL